MLLKIMNTQKYVLKEVLSLGYILSIFLKFPKCQPQYSHKVYSYKHLGILPKFYDAISGIHLFVLNSASKGFSL